MPALIQQEKSRKLSGYEFYREILGSPKYVVAPMVDQSELAWRILSRRYGGQLAYTPMINAKMFTESHRRNHYRELNFNIAAGEEGGPSDRPLIVQFCANNPEQLLEAAKLVEPHCDAVDINFGCPQDIARRGRYGCFLQDDWDLIYNLIHTLHENLSIPVTAKFRVFPSLEKTVEYAKMMERAGAQILTCHGRTREQRGHQSGLADWAKIRAVREAVSVPVFANGNILFHSDIQPCLDATGADAVMSAEGNLYNPTIFASSSLSLPPSLHLSPTSDAWASSLPVFLDDALYLQHTTLALEYLSIVKSLKTTTPLSAVKGHLFKLMRPALVIEKDLRERLGSVRGTDAIQEYEVIIQEMAARMERDKRLAAGKLTEDLVKIDDATGLKVLPHWLAQPYFRPIPLVKDENEKRKIVKAQAIVPPITEATGEGLDENGIAYRSDATAVTAIEIGLDAVSSGLHLGKHALVHSERIPESEGLIDEAKRLKR